MWRYLNYINASSKVLYDKAADYLTNTKEPETSSQNNDYIEDYSDVIKIELYEDETESNRIYPYVGLYNEYSTFWNNPTHVVDNIYLGSAFNAASYETLKELNIKLIINASSEISNYFEDNNEFTYVRYKLYDNNKTRIIKYLQSSFETIINQQNNNGGNILIHCFMGASRSASIVIYYMMKTMKHSNGRYYTFDDAVDYLKQKRITVNPTFRLTKDLASSMMVKQ